MLTHDLPDWQPGGGQVGGVAAAMMQSSCRLSAAWCWADKCSRGGHAGVTAMCRGL